MPTRLITRAVSALAAGAFLMAGAAWAGDKDSCKSVRFSDVGWTDITATTGTAAYIFKSLGYDPKVTILSVPVTYDSLKNKNVDVFLGNWMPGQTNIIKPYQADKSVDFLPANLQGAKFTLAVPSYTYDKGLRSFKDLAKYRTQLHGKIYGIEPGAGGNGLILKMISGDTFGLKGFTLIESSEQGMLAAVEKAIRKRQPIVFLGWAPHPMNTEFSIKYLKDGDDVFGPNYGGATVYTAVRAGYPSECPNAGKLVSNLKFNLDMENTLMGKIMNDHQDPQAAAAVWMKAHPEMVAAWLAGVTTFDGGDGLKAVQAALQSN
jgi:glycine betaine/proline transport system substrate-binding protein